MRTRMRRAALLLVGAVLAVSGAPSLARAQDPSPIILELCSIIGVQGSDVVAWANFDTNMDAKYVRWKNRTPDHCVVIL